MKATNLDEIKIREIFEQFNSFVVKPVSSGSSYGVQIIKDSKDLENFVRNIENNHNIYKKHRVLSHTSDCSPTPTRNQINFKSEFVR